MDNSAVVLNLNVKVTSVKLVIDRLKNWIGEPVGRYICVSNVHMCMEMFDDVNYANIVNGADLTIADGRPIYWAQRMLGYTHAQQNRGYDLTLAICKEAEENQFSVGFYGSTADVVDQISSKLIMRYPKLEISYKRTPPFRPMTNNENKLCIKEIKNSGISVLFVGLGCPKQEIWMAEHKDDMDCVMIGVGAVFNFIAGNKVTAPDWIQSIGLEWLFRLLSDPKRLWKRYFKHNPRFIYYFSLQLLGKNFEN